MILEGVRVVELGSWVAGPAAAGILADWGADVVKVEPPGGDPFRQLFAKLAGIGEPTSPPFDLDNRGKRSVVADLDGDDGRALVAELVAGADVFITNARLGALQRSGLDHETLLAAHPRLVYCSVTGYGLRGDQADRPGYDLGAFWGRSGASWASAPEGEEPPLMRGGMGDHVTGLAAAAGIMAGLFRRERTGLGGLVETSLLRAGIYLLGWDLSIQQRFGKVAASPPRTEALNPMINTYRAGDGRWFLLLGLEADRHWPRLLDAIGRRAWAADERFSTARDRRRNACELIGRLDELFATEPLGHWADRFDAAGVWWDAVLTPSEVVTDAQAAAAGAWVDVEGYGPMVATPVSFDGVTPQPRAGPPALP